MKRLSLEELDDRHLTWLQKALDCSNKPDLGEWLEDWNAGRLAVYEVTGGIVGLREWKDRVWIELLAGEGMKDFAREILQAIRDFAGNNALECLAVEPHLARFYQRLGFKAYGTLMRIEP